MIVALGATTGVVAAAPGGVAYIDGGHVQIAKLDGTKKIQLSDGLAWWNAVAQSDTGGVLATKNEPGKIAQLSLFQTWDASGNPARFGPLNHDASGASLAMPLTLELTASNGLMVYGYSAQFWGYPTSTFSQGYYMQTTTMAAVGTPLKQTVLRWPTLAGDRVVGTSDELTISVLNADQNFVGNETTLWPNIDVSGLPGAKLRRTSLSTDGTVLAAEVVFWPDSKIAMIRTPGLGQAPLPGDCWLPVAGKGTNPSVSQDGTLIAWKDDQGVKIAGVPDFSGAEPCNLTRPPVVISATGAEPALGPIDVDAIWAARNPAPAAPGALGALANPAAVTLSVTPPARVTAKALTSTRGITLTVAIPVSGKVRVAVTIQPRLVGRTGRTPIVIATGTATAAVAGKLKVRVRPTPIGRKLTAQLRGKRVTITVRIGTWKTTKLIRLW